MKYSWLAAIAIFLSAGAADIADAMGKPRAFKLALISSNDGYGNEGFLLFEDRSLAGFAMTAIQECVGASKPQPFIF